PAALRPAQRSAHSAVRLARRARGKALQGGKDGRGDLLGRAERDQPQEPRGDRLRSHLQAKGLHHRLTHLAGARREVVMVKRALAIGMALVACKPNVDETTSHVTSPRFLAVRSEPAEAAPLAPVTLTALYVDVT